LRGVFVLRGAGMSLVCRVQHLMRGREWRVE
jgi:hypothetical protein